MRSSFPTVRGDVTLAGQIFGQFDAAGSDLKSFGPPESTSFRMAAQG